LYDRDGRTLLVTRDSYTDGESEYLDWKCPLDGVYYVRILQANTEIFGQDTGYDLAIYLPVMSAGTGIIAGSIVNSISGSLIDGALIKTDVGGAALSQDGYYVMLHPSGIPSLTCNALNYLPATASLSLNAGDTSIKDISLIPLGALSTTTTTTATGNTCMIEAIYGNQAEETVVLKHFRDTVLTNARCGRKIIKAYYEWGPGLLVLMQQHHQVRHLLKHVVDDMIVFIKASSPFF
ncbi:MAG: CFI-box-CTERM domain-containing protein, partial [Pseudomonadota bacterium]